MIYFDILKEQKNIILNLYFTKTKSGCSKMRYNNPDVKSPQRQLANPTTKKSPNKKQFPSITLSKHLDDYKAYRSIDQRIRLPQKDQKSFINTSMLSNDQKSILKNDMPSIHCNETLLVNEPQTLKLQKKVLKFFENTKKVQQWKLYMTKSQLAHERDMLDIEEVQQIQTYLLKTLSKVLETKFRNVQQLIKEDQQNSKLSLAQNFNKTFSNSICQLQSNKPVAPSLKVLKDNLNVPRNKNQDSSILDMSSNNQINKTSIGFNNKKDKHTNFNQHNNSTFVQKINNSKQQEINKLTFEKSLVEKKVELCEKKIRQLQEQLREYKKKIGFSGTGGTYNGSTNDQFIENVVAKNKYKDQAEFKKIQNQTLTRELIVIREYSQKLKLQNVRLQQKHVFMVQENNACREFLKYRELWLMESEQNMYWKEQCQIRKEESLKLLNKIKILKEKNKQLLHSFNFSMVVNPDQQEDKQQLENIIKSFQEWLRVISVPRVNCTFIDPNTVGQQKTIEETQYLPDPDNVNYKLLRPNFFIFFEAYEKTIMMEKNILNTRPLEATFFIKIRAIMDAMYNHFNCFNHYKHWMSFPQFVMGFLEKYEVNYTTLKVEARRKPMPSQQKLTFLMNLFNKKVSNTWECQIFRNFILQDYTLDEIYFFLDCRNDIHGGSTLIHGFGQSDPVVYVKLQKALATAQKKLSPYENHIIERVKNILKSRKKDKNGDSFIDRNFALKLLLEVYSLEKIKSQRVFEASFKTKNKKLPISYSDFYTFMAKNFEFLNPIQICQLYRQTYGLSSGKITHKSVHYVCCSKGLFIPLIITKRLSMNVLDKSLSNDMILLDLQNSTRKVSMHLQNNGVQPLSRLQNDINMFLRQVDWYRNNRQMFYFKLLEQKIRIVRANCMLDWQASTHNPAELLSSEEIRDGILQLHNLIHQSDSSVKVISQAKDKKEKAIKLLTRNFKIRIQESMSQFKRVDDAQLKKLKEQVAMEIKVRQMRNHGNVPTEDDNEKTANPIKSNLIKIGARNNSMTDKKSF